ncbi:arylamine N-acetyltransferase family protein [Amycolatopsis regifaucium]|uniref:Arylamine N-acetyltransferase n=1 Tax=Amycolatopsis regifaucium TaxID=546365 RepID=A0A154MIR6_9PSEU|nr:arylamine N-acetyltransferase [Amycolatopsis regifaucium]KZB83990.1 arylamine N-acetyltransferase [Amycolatopsis regifaucium]OKA06972.1 arylamine N-acetyltransferase [Amycolatopsis regifaucium]
MGSLSSEHVDVPAYLARLGLEHEPPSLDALFRLHKAHVERVPYEDLEVQLGRVTSLDPAVSFGRIAAGRGGYCYHLNGALSALLLALGYQVTRHPGGVQGHGETAGIHLNHLALTVTGLPETPEVGWMVDVGLGDGIHEPLPLREGEYKQGPLVFRMRPSEITPGGWRFDHDPQGSFVGMDFAPETAVMQDFAEKHVELSTSETSGFVRTVVLQRRAAESLDTLRALTLSRLPGGKTVLESPAEWWTAIEDVFGIPRRVFTDEERDRLWRQAVSQHERHLAGAEGSAVSPSA